MLSAKHCNVPSKKEGHCLLCADSLFSQTVNQPHCPTRSFSLFILFIKLNGKGRNMEKKKTHKTWDSGQGGKHKATVFNSACKERVISQRLLQKNGWKCVRKRISQRTSNLQNNTWQLISIFHPKVKEFPNVNAYRFPGHYIMSHLFFPSSAGFRPVLLFFLLLLPALSQLETNDSSTWIILFIVSLYKLMFT